MRFEALLFDLDGTLTNSAPGIIASLRCGLAELGHPVAPEADLSWCIGPPLKLALPTLLKSEDPELIEAAVAAYRRRYGEVGLFENEVYDGVVPALEVLHGQGRRLFVATSKPEIYAKRIIDHFGMTRYFEQVHGSLLDGVRDDKGELIRYILETERLIPARTLMIGDRWHDAVGARKAGIACMMVHYGFAPAGEIERVGPDAVCATPQDLPLEIAALEAAMDQTLAEAG